jgi:hypothetical protein
MFILSNSHRGSPPCLVITQQEHADLCNVAAPQKSTRYYADVDILAMQTAIKTKFMKVIRFLQ